MDKFFMRQTLYNNLTDIKTLIILAFISDHMSIMLSDGGEDFWISYPFKFNLRWLQMKNSLAMVNIVWKSPLIPFPMDYLTSICKKLSAFKKEIHIWILEKSR